MCRVYKSKVGNYIRLCYRFGPRRGEKVYFTGAPPLGPSGHYVDPLKRPGGKRERRREVRRCPLCGTPAVSRHETLCSSCKAGLK